MRAQVENAFKNTRRKPNPSKVEANGLEIMLEAALELFKIL